MKLVINPVSALMTTGPVTLGLTMAKFYPWTKLLLIDPRRQRSLPPNADVTKRFTLELVEVAFFWKQTFLYFKDKLLCLDLFLYSSFPHYTESKTTRVMCRMNLKNSRNLLNIIKVMYDTPTRVEVMAPVPVVQVGESQGEGSLVQAV